MAMSCRESRKTNMYQGRL